MIVYSILRVDAGLITYQRQLKKKKSKMVMLHDFFVSQAINTISISVICNSFCMVCGGINSD